MEPVSRVATLALAIAVLAALAFVGAPLAIQAGLAPPGPGFRVFFFAVPVSLVALLLGCVGLWTTRAASGRRGRGRAVAAALLGAVMVGTVLAAVVPSAGLPTINDITTDPADPPAFAAAAAELGADLAYPGDAFAAQQAEGYPDLAPIRLDVPPDEALARAEDAAVALGWTIAERDPEAGRFEAFEVSRIFRFVDDVVVRVRPRNGGSLVDVRSRSRVGRGDLGANAARIRALRDRLVGSAP